MKNYPKVGVKVKELIIKPGQSTSLQRHKYRSELMFVTQGTLTNETDSFQSITNANQMTTIGQHQWHKLCNHGDEDLHIVEIQYGDKCEEEDIERKD